MTNVLLKLLIVSEIGTDWKKRNWDENFNFVLKMVARVLIRGMGVVTSIECN